MAAVPMVAAVATEEPEMEPKSAEVSTATLAGPPRQRPATNNPSAVNAAATHTAVWPRRRSRAAEPASSPSPSVSRKR
jgi:hypothetical protein